MTSLQTSEQPSVFPTRSSTSGRKSSRGSSKSSTSKQDATTSSISESKEQDASSANGGTGPLPAVQSSRITNNFPFEMLSTFPPPTDLSRSRLSEGFGLSVFIQNCCLIPPCITYNSLFWKGGKRISKRARAIGRLAREADLACLQEVWGASQKHLTDQLDATHERTVGTSAVAPHVGLADLLTPLAFRARETGGLFHTWRRSVLTLQHVGKRLFKEGYSLAKLNTTCSEFGLGPPNPLDICDDRDFPGVLRACEALQRAHEIRRASPNEYPDDGEGPSHPLDDLTDDEIEVLGHVFHTIEDVDIYLRAQQLNEPSTGAPARLLVFNTHFTVLSPRARLENLRVFRDFVIGRVWEEFLCRGGNNNLTNTYILFAGDFNICPYAHPRLWNKLITLDGQGWCRDLFAPRENPYYGNVASRYTKTPPPPPVFSPMDETSTDDSSDSEGTQRRTSSYSGAAMMDEEGRSHHSERRSVQERGPPLQTARRLTPAEDSTIAMGEDRRRPLSPPEQTEFDGQKETQEEDAAAPRHLPGTRKTTKERGLFNSLSNEPNFRGRIDHCIALDAISISATQLDDLLKSHSPYDLLSIEEADAIAARLPQEGPLVIRLGGILCESADVIVKPLHHELSDHWGLNFSLVLLPPQDSTGSSRTSSSSGSLRDSLSKSREDGPGEYGKKTKNATPPAPSKGSGDIASSSYQE